MGSYKSKYTGEQVDCILDYVKTRKGEGITEWQPNTEYKWGQCIYERVGVGEVRFLICVEEHTSGETFDMLYWNSAPPEYATKAFTDMRGDTIHNTYARKDESFVEWQPNTEYKEGQFCFRIGTSGMVQFYRCMRDYVSGDEFNTDPDGHMAWMYLQVEEAMTAYCDILMRRIDETYAPIAQWQPWLGYNKNQLVFTVENGVFTVYECNTNHTADSKIDTEKFTKLFYGATSGVGGSNGISLWQPNTYYTSGQIVVNNGSNGLAFLFCATNHTSGNTIDYQNFLYLQITEAVSAYNDMMNRPIHETYVEKVDTIAKWYPYTNYTAGQCVYTDSTDLINGISIYRCNTAHTSSAIIDTGYFTRLKYTIADYASEAERAVGDLQGNMIHETYANTLKGYASGNIVHIDDVSPVANGIKVKVSGENLDPTTVTVTACGKNIIDLTAFEFDDTSYTHSFGASNATAVELYNLLKNNAGKYITMSAKITGTAGGATIGSIRYVDANGGIICIITPGVPFLIKTDLPDTFSQCIVYGSNTGASVKDIQIEYGKNATDYEAYNGRTYRPAADGSLGIYPMSPTTTLFTDTAETIIDVEYNQDTNKVIGDIDTALDRIIEIQNAYIGGESV